MTPVGRPLTRLRAAFNEAEGFAREVGELRSNVPVPAYNQLRYAGYHLLKALDDDAQVVNEPEINKAVGHCERAMYDAAEAGIIQALRELAAFRYEYRFLNISAHVEGYGDMRRRAKTGQRLIIDGRHKRESVREHVREYMTAFRELADDLDVRDASRDSLNAERRQQTIETRRFWIRTAAILAGPITVALIALFF